MSFSKHFARNGYASLAAAGGNQGAAAAIVTDVVLVTGADGAKGVRLPVVRSADKPEQIVVINNEAAQNLKLYPQTGGKINGGATNAAITLSGAVTVTLTPVSATEWYTGSQNLSGSQAAGAAGVVEASKATVVDANKDIADYRNLSATNLKAGKDAVAGTITVFPTTTAKGKLVITKSDNTNDETTTLNVALVGQVSTITLPDPAGAAGTIALLEITNAFTAKQTITKASATTTAGLIDLDVAETVPTASITAGSYYATRSIVTLSGSLTGGAFVSGIRSGLIISGTMNHADSRVAGNFIKIDATGATLTAGQLSGLWIDYVGASGDGGGQFNMIRLTDVVVGSKPAAVLYYQGDASYLLDLLKASGGGQDWVVTAAVGGAQSRKLRIRVDGTDFYIPLHTA